MAMDYGLCKGKRKDGGACTMPVNKAEGGGYCEFHVVAAFNRAQRKDPLRNSSKGGIGSSNSNKSNTNSKLNNTANFLASGDGMRGLSAPVCGFRPVLAKELEIILRWPTICEWLALLVGFDSSCCKSRVLKACAFLPPTVAPLSFYILPNVRLYFARHMRLSVFYGSGSSSTATPSPTSTPHGRVLTFDLAGASAASTTVAHGAHPIGNPGGGGQAKRGCGSHSDVW